ncbi:hypothetical protein DTO013F2_10114 [Penicillium roqueforti]|nr:hypothetical protein DTO013F2_10114 [Penicillium roqueforti]
MIQIPDYRQVCCRVHGATGGQAEFYNSCAQVKVVGGGNGTPRPTVKFPGAYKKDDPSLNFSICNGYKEYPMPGPEVWTGESVSNSASKVARINNTASAATSNKQGEDTCDSAFTRCARSCFQFLKE